MREAFFYFFKNILKIYAQQLDFLGANTFRKNKSMLKMYYRKNLRLCYYCLGTSILI